MKLRVMAGIVGLVVAVSAHGQYRPMVDEAMIQDRARYEFDLSQCQSYAARVSPARNSVVGAVAGAVLGAAIGVAVGNNSDFARYGARAGAISGAVGGAGNAYQVQINIVRNCMAGRGYQILDAPSIQVAQAYYPSAQSAQEDAIARLRRTCAIAPGTEGCDTLPPEPEPTPEQASVSVPATPPSEAACRLAPGLPGCAPAPTDKESSND